MRITIRSCDDWVAVYKDGQQVWSNHSCDLAAGLDALGIDYTDEWVEVNEWGEALDGSDPFPERLAE